MKHRLLAAQYRSLAGALAEERAAAETLGCLARALELDRSGSQPVVREILASLEQLDLGQPPGEPSGELLRLRRRKQKLDRLLAREHEICDSVDMAEPTGETEPSCESIPAEMIRRISELHSRLGGRQGELYENARRQLQAFLDPCNSPAETSLHEVAGTSELDAFFPVEQDLHNLANDFYKLDRFDDAITCYDIVLEIDEDLLESRFNRGLAHTRKRNYDRAEADLTRVIDLNANLAEAWYTRGLVREYKEDYSGAVSDYDKAVEVDPDYGKAREQREKALKKLDESRTRRRGRRDDSDDSEGRVKDFSPYLSKPNMTLADVGGHRDVKRRLRTIAAYLKGNPVLAEWGAELPRGVLLCGRPGVGKTHLARCLAGEANCPFYAPPTSVFEDMWAGNMQKNLRKLWEQAGEHSKAIIFLDEFDSLGSCRTGARDPDAWYNRMVGCILELMDNLARRSERIVVIAATNRKENIDEAFLRPGRFTYIVEVHSPTACEVAEIWLIHLEAASQRATRPDFVTPELQEALLARRHDWLERAFRSQDDDPSGLVSLARLSAAKDLVGDDVREVIRRTLDERVMAAMDGLDLGPISPDDLYRQLEDYEPQRPESDDEDD